MEQTKVLEIKVHTQQFDDRSDKTGLVASDYDIIHIEQEKDNGRTMPQDEKIAICNRSTEAYVQQLGSESLKPSSRGLFETIESLVKEVDMLRKGRINIALSLGHIHLFLENPMQKCITYIQLPQFPTKLDCQS